ncbi:beta strand repeat-containing protein [Pseudoxanthomonas yeongjuensis]|uniref:beta strand repeat-containing protein n=1 Tax=Pseudoxanthomonas yeongjuensis TaxID=377616 RepID=UPI001391FBF7|nr:autotransporter outer membrane beta-barrel domain-containing protein [Pseudoxanthomonas yeongjuensis]
MTGFAQHNGAPTRRANTIPAVAPIARAVRAALAVSATMLAFSAPVMAHADGACGPTASQQAYACDDATIHIEVGATAPYDLTRLADGERPVSVNSPVGGKDGLVALADDPSGDESVRSMTTSAPAVDWLVDDITAVGGDNPEPHAFTSPAQAGTFASVDSTVHAYGSDVAINYGITESTESFTYLTNYDSVSASADAEDGDAFVIGALAQGWDAATLHNYADIAARASSDTADAQAYAAVADGAHNNGIGILINGGDLVAEATAAGADGLAYATGAYAIGNVASVFNDLNSTATAIAGEGGGATARGARAYGSYTAVYSYGDLTAIASADGGTADARGADSAGYYGSTVYNAGNIHSSATGADLSTSIGAYSVGAGFSAYTTNTGSILAEAQGEGAKAYGVVNASLYLGDAITINQGDISAVAVGGQAAYGEAEAYAFGVYNLATIYASSIDNSGTIAATALAQADMSGTDGFLQAKSIGAIAVNSLGYWDADIVNSGEIGAISKTSQGYASAWGAVVQSSGAYGGAVSLDNTGSIWGYAQADLGVANAIAAYAVNQMGAVDVANYGDIEAVAHTVRGDMDRYVTSYAYATGVKAAGLYGFDGTHVDNHGSIVAHASAEAGIAGSIGIGASGVYTSIANAADASVVSIGEAELYGGGFATGIEATGIYGIDVVNDGQITAYGHAHGYAYGTHTFYSNTKASGIYAGAGFQGDASIVNNGDIAAIAVSEDAVNHFSGGAGATGVQVYAKYDGLVVNSGDITASATANLGITGAYGAMVTGKYSGNLINEAGATITAQATVGSLYSDAYAGRAVTFGVHTFRTDHGGIYNAGTVISHATVTADGGANASRSLATAFGASIGYNSVSLTGEMVNLGDVEAVASADFGYASAYGTFVQAQYDSSTDNTGAIRAGAMAANGDAWAVGSYGFSMHQTVTYNCDAYGCDWANPVKVTDGGKTAIDNSGSIVATASADGGVGRSYGAVALGALTAGITNAGHITAVAEADDAIAVGALANSFYGNARVVNGGDIAAAATGTTANATGANVLGEEGVQVDNAGRILAAAYGSDATAIAVSMDSQGNNVLTNTGTIGAFGDGTRIAISSGADATASIDNRGDLTGAVVTGGFGDSLTNATGATWLTMGYSEFGGGDDHIVNNGLVIMENAVIELGAADSGNSFFNVGTLRISGGGNAIGSATLVNDGIISFLDGDTDDALVLTGALEGQGTINLDVNAADLSSDIFRTGQAGTGQAQTQAVTAFASMPLAAASVQQMQTLNVGLIGLPGTASSDITLAHVPTAQADGFSLGQVQYARTGFVSLDFGLKASADPSNAAETILALSMDVTGLNDAGSAAAAIAPGVQSMINAQVGAYRPRVVASPDDAGPSPWLRMFSSSGDVELQHDANYGDGGSFGFHQSNRGWELGLDVRPSDTVSLGVLIGKSEADQSLGGAGRDDLDGRTFGLYGTWLDHGGTYADVSHRWIGIDAHLRSSSAEYRTETSAQATNVEVGHIFATAGGLRIVPQLQYTRTRIDDMTALRGGGTAFASEGGTSSRGRLGVTFEKTFQARGFAWSPYGTASAVREFDGEFSHAIGDGLQGAVGTKGNSAMVELGLTAQRNGLSISGGLDWTDGGSLQSVHGGQLTVRYGW